MIFDLHTSKIDGKQYAVFFGADLCMNDLDSAKNNPFELVNMLRNCFPEDAHYIACYGNYENAVNLN